MKHTAKVILDDFGYFALPLSDELLEKMGWEIGDTLEWIDNQDGTWSLKKADEQN